MLIPWLSRYFYFYYPALIVLVCAATLFSVGTRLASLLGYQKFLGEDDFSVDFIDEGKVFNEKRFVQYLYTSINLCNNCYM